MKGSHRKCEEAPKKYDENRRASSSFGMLNGANAAYGKGIWKARLLKRFKGGTVILCGDKGICKTAHGHEKHSLRSACTFRDYFAPSGLVPLLRNGANRHPRIAIRSLPAPSFGCGSRPAKYKEKEECKSIPLFSWCTFRGYFAPWGLVPPQAAGRTDNEGHSLRSVCTFRD